MDWSLASVMHGPLSLERESKERNGNVEKIEYFNNPKDFFFDEDGLMAFT
jgi:hypothetical protein